MRQATFPAKIDILREIDDYARNLDKRVVQVSATLAASLQEIFILRPEGALITDTRPMSRLNVSVIVEENGKRESGGMGGGGMGGGGGGAMSGRAAATALGKVTWILAILFICTSITLTILAAQKAGSSSVIDQIGAPTPAPATPTAPLGSDLLPPAPTNAPLAPPRAEN